MGRKLKALDLFCGLGGWSDGLALEGFEVLGVEIEPKIAKLYEHPVIVADVCSLDPLDFTGYDLIVGSPPCRDFSPIGNLFGKKWKRPPDPKGEGMRVVNVFLDFIKIAKPTYWLLENVVNLINHLKVPPRCVTYIGASMRRAFWGNFPSFLIPRDFNKPLFYLPGTITPNEKDYPRHMGKWLRAKIPLPVARSLGRSIANVLEDVP